MLEAYGIPLAPAVMAQSAREAAAAADQLGYPCVLKVASVDIPHKTEFGALRLGLENQEAVRKAYDEMFAAVKAKKPDADIEGVLVQQQIKGVECLLGISRDEQLGPTLVMGLGGIFVEILADVAIRIPPIDAAEARRALENLKGAKYSPARAAHRPLISMHLQKWQPACLGWPTISGDDIAELDLNPVVVLPKGQGAFAVDALLIARNPQL